VIGWDGKKVKFQCLPHQVEWAEGCGFEGEVEPFGGNGKLPWKVEWPAKFFETKSDIEGEGKDHATKGGSRQIADMISKKIYKHTPPYDIPYEWLLISGAKMSSSKGIGATAKSIYDFLPSNILRFLFTRTKYRKTADFNPEGDTILTLYDDYDRALSAYHEDPQSDAGRAFYFSEIGLEKELPKYILRFSKIANMLQMPRADIFKYAEQEKGLKITTTKNVVERVRIYEN
jgi:lysyl-tRNA synthetase class 1